MFCLLVSVNIINLFQIHVKNLLILSDNQVLLIKFKFNQTKKYLEESSK